MASINPIKETLHNMTAKDLVSERAAESLVTLREDNTIEQAVKLLSNAKVLSAPVLKKSGETLGFVDMLDIVWFVVSVAPDPADLKEEHLRSQNLEIAGRAMSLQTVNHIVGKSGRDPYVPIYETSPVTMLVDLFSQGIHRVAVYNADNSVLDIVSQSRIVRMMSEKCHMGSWKQMGELTIEQLGLSQGKVVSVKETDTVLQVLKTMKDAEVSAVAVVDAQGNLFGNFSGSDLRAMYLEKWPSFLQPVGQYLREHSVGSTTPITCSPSTTLLDVCKIVTEKHVHRLWVVDEGARTPHGIVSTTDILRVVNSYDVSAH